MISAEQLSALTALTELSHELAGQLAAQRAINEALIATVTMAFPPLSGQITKNIIGLAAYSRNSLTPEMTQSFDAGIQRMLDNIKAMTGG